MNRLVFMMQAMTKSSTERFQGDPAGRKYLRDFGGTMPVEFAQCQQALVPVGRPRANWRAGTPATTAAANRHAPAVIVTITYLLVGVLLFAATLPIGTSTLASGK
jgi:hypothetical protein